MVSPRLQGARRFVRSALVAATTLTLVTCAEDPVGPASGEARLRIVPVFASSMVPPLTIDRVHVQVQRPDPVSETFTTVFDDTVSFSADANSLTLRDIQVRMTAQSEDLLVVLELMAGNTVLFSGSQTVTVIRGQSTQPTSLTLFYAGPGANVARLALAPRDTVVSPGAVVDYQLDAYDSAGAPVPQYYASWSLTGGPAAGATINAAGRLTAPAVPDTFFVKAVNIPTSSADSTRVIVSNGPIPSATLVWNGAVSTDWSVAGNWSPAQVPGPSDSVVIGTAGSGRQPTLTTTSLAGAISIVAGGNLTIGGQGIAVTRGFSTSGSGVLTMTSDADVVVIAGNAVFDGGSELGLLSGGSLSIGGNLTQRATNSGDSFHPSATHITVLQGANPTLSFATPGLVDGTSHFQELAWVGQGTLTLATPVFAHGQFVMPVQGTPTVSSGNGSRLTVASLVAAVRVTLNNVPLTLQQDVPGPLALDNVTFQNMPTNVGQLVVSHPGASVTFSNLIFSTLPVAPNGFYLDATDLDGAAANGALSIIMVNPTPASAGTFLRTANGAQVVWGGGATVTWTGAVDNLWNTAGNWTPRLPIAADNVVIPAVNNHPSLTSSVAVNNLQLQAGAGLDLGSGFSISVSGSLAADAAISGFGAGSQVTLSGAGQTIHGSIDATVSVSGSYTLDGTLNVGTNSNGLFTLGIPGSLTLGGHTVNLLGTLATSGTGVLRMQQALDSMIITRGAFGGGGASFGGGSSTGLLTAGVLVLTGPAAFTQSGAATSFAPSGSHKTVFNQYGGTISFGSPASSGFQDADLTGSGPTLQTDVRVNGVLTADSTAAGAPGVTSATGAVLTAAGVDISSLRINGVPMVIGPGTITQFDNVNFGGLANTVVQLTVNHPGAATPFTFTNLTFLTTPAVGGPGLYLRANDTDGAATGILTINLANPNPATPSGFIQQLNGALVGWPLATTRTWIGASGASWFTATNWSPTGVPAAVDNVVIGASTVTLDPCSASPATAVDLTLQAGGQITGACQLLVAGNLTSTGTTNVDVALTGAGKTLQGNFGAVTMVVTGTVSLAGNTTVQGNVGTSGGDLTLGGHSLRAAGFATAGTGTLTMTSASDSLIVSGATIFGGGSTAGKLTAGRLLVGGSLTQTGTGSIFAPSGSHRTVFTELSTLTLADTVNSGFQDLDMNGQTVTAESAVPIKGTLFASGLSFLELPNGNRVTTAGVNVSALTVETGTMLIQGGPIVQFDTVTFGLQPPTVTPLTIRHPGAATPFTFTQLHFVTTPTGGAVYIDATDTDGAASGVLTINMVTPNPVSPSGLIATSGGAVISWGPVAFIWNGSSSTDWSTGANWSGGIVPGTSDSVFIPATTNQPVLTAAVSVGAVEVNAGTLNLNGQTLTVSRTFTTTGTGTLTSTTAASLLVVAGNALFNGGDETGKLTDGNLRVAGNFTQGTTANSFVATGAHTTFLNGTGAQTVTIANGGAAASRFHNLRVINAGGTVTLSGTTPELVVNGVLNVTNNATLTGATAVTAASVATTTGSTLSVFLLTVPTGGLSVQGTYAVSLTILTGGGTVPALTYNSLRLTGATGYSLGANVATGGYLDLQSDLAVAGHTAAVGGDLMINGTGTLTMTNAADLVTVVGSTSFYGGDETNKLTAGILRTSNQFLQDATNSPTSFIASGTHTVEIVSQNPTGGVVNLATPAVARFQNLRVLFVSTFVSDVEVKGNMEVNFNVAGNFFAKRVTVSGTFTKAGIGFFGPTRLTLLGSSAVTGGTIGPDTLEFAGSSPQTYPDPSSTFPKYVLVANDVTADTGTAGITNDLEIRGTGIFRLGATGNTFNVGGDFRTVGSGRLEMVDPTGTLTVTGSAAFSGGSEVGLLTAGLLQIGGDLMQTGTPSDNRFAATGTHVTRLTGGATTVSMVGSAAGVLFGDLEVSTTGPVTVAALSGDRFDGTGQFRVITPVAVTFGELLFLFDGGITTVSGSSIASPGPLPFNLRLPGTRIQGSYNVANTNVATVLTGVPVQLPSLPYQFLSMGGGGNFFMDNVVSVSGDFLPNNGTFRIQDTLGTRSVLTVGGSMGCGGSCSIELSGGKVIVGGSLSFSGSNSRLLQTSPADSLLVSGNVVFSGGSTAGTLTAGLLQVGGDFRQVASSSVTSFAPSGTHKTVFVNTATKAISMGSPGAGAAGSHFQVLDVSGATGGLTLDVNMQADSIISTSAAAKISSPGVKLTVRSSQVSGLTLDNTEFVVDEQGTAASQKFDNVTFQNLPTDGATALTMIGPGNPVGTPARALTFNNVNFSPQILAGSTSLYVALTSSNLLGFNLIMNGSNQSPPGGNGPTFTGVTPATGIAIVTWQ